MKHAKFTITRQVKSGITYYTLSIPAYLNPAGKTTRVYYRTKAEAERKRGELIASTRTESRDLTLTNAQSLDAQRALARLAEAGLTLTLDRAIELALPLLKTSGVRMTVDELLALYHDRKNAEWSRVSKTNFRRAAARFLATFSGTYLSEIDPATVEQWLRSRKISTLTIESELRLIRCAFNFAVRQQILPVNPLNRIELPRYKPRTAIDIFTPAEAAHLMATAPADCRAAFAILLFAGVRPTELTRLHWHNIRDGFIYITPDIAKTSQVRNVEIEPTLAAWLAAYPCPDPNAKIIAPNWKRKYHRTRRRAGLAGRNDTARHSYASYHLAKYKNRGATEANLGHVSGSNMLMMHYRAATTPADAEAYWSILPPTQ